MRFRRALHLFALLFISSLSNAQQPTAQADEVTALRAEMAAMRKELQAQIDLLKTQIAMSPPGSVTGTSAALGTPSPGSPSGATSAVGRDMAAEESSSAPGAVAAARTVVKPQIATETPGPSSIRFKGVDLTPGGFISLDSLYRSKAMASEVNTAFAQIPYAGSGQAHVSEWNWSGRQSRFSLLGEAKTRFGKLSGYYEADFLSAGATSNTNQSNSYTLRQRQMVLQAAMNSGWTVSGGHMWTLATENRRGADPRTESLPTILDGAQHTGFNWGRSGALRVTKKLGTETVLAFALEQSQTLFSATNAPSNFFLGAAGSALGAFNPGFNYTDNPAPDVLAKVAFDPIRSGLWRGHYELGLVGRIFRDRYYPSGSASPQNDSKAGGGFFLSARVPFGERLEVGAKVLAGRGVGRYGAATLPDVTVHPDGTLAPLRGAQAFFRAEFKATKKLDLFTYDGLEYAGRLFYRDASGTLVGYAPTSMNNTGCNIEAAPAASTGFAPGSPVNCVGATRMVTQRSFGYVYRLYEGPSGRLQFTTVYSYLTRDGWAGIGGAPRATNHFVYSGLRYYLP